MIKWRKVNQGENRMTRPSPLEPDASSLDAVSMAQGLKKRKKRKVTDVGISSLV